MLNPDRRDAAHLNDMRPPNGNCTATESTDQPFRDHLWCDRCCAATLQAPSWSLSGKGGHAAINGQLLRNCAPQAHGTQIRQARIPDAAGYRRNGPGRGGVSGEVEELLGERRRWLRKVGKGEEGWSYGGGGDVEKDAAADA